MGGRRGKGGQREHWVIRKDTGARGGGGQWDERGKGGNGGQLEGQLHNYT